MRNHERQMLGCDFFVAVTAMFEIVCVFVILSPGFATSTGLNYSPRKVNRPFMNAWTYFLRSTASAVGPIHYLTRGCRRWAPDWPIDHGFSPRIPLADEVILDYLWLAPQVQHACFPAASAAGECCLQPAGRLPEVWLIGRARRARDPRSDHGRDVLVRAVRI